jgi:hypothetical protein
MLFEVLIAPKHIGRRNNKIDAHIGKMRFLWSRKFAAIFRRKFGVSRNALNFEIYENFVPKANLMKNSVGRDFQQIVPSPCKQMHLTVSSVQSTRKATVYLEICTQKSSLWKYFHVKHKLNQMSISQYFPIKEKLSS